MALGEVLAEAIGKLVQNNRPPQRALKATACQAFFSPPSYPPFASRLLVVYLSFTFRLLVVYLPLTFCQPFATYFCA
jgi:hypothetical protein